MTKIILIVESSASIRKFISLSLKIAGYNTLIATDGMDALEKISNIEVDMVITDLNLPNIDGLNFIKTLKKDKKFENLPIIVLTSLSDENDIKEAMEAGASSYLIKPFNDKKLLFEVSKYLN